MTVRFQADADLNQLIVRKTLRQEPAIDFQTAAVAGLVGRTDPEVLALAARQGRIVVTHDQSTMPLHFADFITTQESAGLLIITQDLPLNIAVDDLILIWAASEADEWVNCIAYLPL
jgi:predicted nuclease of predicted toxin-antitoxin system